MVEAVEERLRYAPYGPLIKEQFDKDPARCLRDYCTVGMLLPQRSGKTAMTMFMGQEDLVVYANEKEHQAHSPGFGELPPFQVSIAQYQFRGVQLDRVRRIWVMDPFWNDTGVDKMHYFTLVAETFKRPIISVLLDSPVTERT